MCGTFTIPLVPLHLPAVTMTWQRTKGSARVTSVDLKEEEKDLVLEVVLEVGVDVEREKDNFVINVSKANKITQHNIA